MKLKIETFARDLSHQLHARQTRNDRITPYTVHTDYVGDNSAKFLPLFYNHCDVTPHLRALASSVGYLHDSIEDVLYSKEALIKFGETNTNFDSSDKHDWKVICNCVLSLSRMTKEDSVMDYLKGIKQNVVCISVKLADLEHNMSDLKPGNLRDKYELFRALLLTPEGYVGTIGSRFEDLL